MHYNATNFIFNVFLKVCTVVVRVCNVYLFFTLYICLVCRVPCVHALIFNIYFYPQAFGLTLFLNLRKICE